ncbi:MAG: hypothetical protein OXN27_00595 [Candidatus Poribacteria bacterium]|nr:hypothetical protein [Candidatus Poribacteria bacterium]
MELVTLYEKCYERFEERMQAMHRYLTTRPIDFEGLAIKHYVLRQAQEMLIRFREAIDREDVTACVILRRGLESWSPFLEHYLAAVNLQEANHVIEFSRDPEFPNLKPIWSEHERVNDDK